MELLTKSLGLLFSAEGKKFKVIKFSPPFIYATTGVFECVLGSSSNKGIDVTPFNIEGDMPTWDYRVIFFPDKKKTSEDSANIVLVANDGRYKDRWDDPAEFVKTIRYKTWIEL